MGRAAPHRIREPHHNICKMCMGPANVRVVDIDVSVQGGGFMSQANAVRTAIARGLVDFTGDAGLKVQYLNYDRNLLVNDARIKESKKPLGRGARKKRQKSYR